MKFEKDIPGSSPEGKAWIQDQIVLLRQSYDIKSVIDIGCGYATYYFHFKQYLPNTEWTAVEIWEPYVKQYDLDKHYDHVIIDDASMIDYEKLGRYSIAFVGDVLEHMDKESALRLFNSLINACDFMFISIPIVYYPCDQYEHNPHLRHVKPDWSDDEVEQEFGKYIRKKSLGTVVGTYLLSKSEIVMKEYQTKKTFHFLAGLPRSGSTVLESLLNQNPEVYVTPTSPMLHLLNKNQEEFERCPEVIANRNFEMLTNMSRGMIEGIWEHRPENIIIDKHRGWGKNMPASTIVFGKEIKMVATIRDIPSIMASWLTLIRNQPDNFVRQSVIKKGFNPTEENIMAEMWFEHVLDCVESVVMARRTASNRLLEINYDDFVIDPLKHVKKIEEFLELPSYDYDFENITNDDKINNDIEAFGFHDMHKIRPKVEKIAKHPREVLGDSLYNRFVDLGEQYGI